MRCFFILAISILCAGCFQEPPPIEEDTDLLDGTVLDAAGDLPEDSALDVNVTPACVTDCSGHGACDEEIGLCACSPEWTGSDCSTCAPDYFGPNCLSCSCIHGQCDDGDPGSGACTCDDGWAGAVCDVSLAVAWNAGPYGSEDGETAGDVTFPTTDGEFSLAQAWTGHESALFLFHYPLAAESVTLWENEPKALFATLPMNTHVVFGSFDNDHETAVASMKARVQTALSSMSVQLQDHWTNHVHFISEKVGSFEGALDERIKASSSYKFGIDRYQRWRSLGALYDPSVQESSIAYLGHEPWGYNAEHAARSAVFAREGLSLALFDLVSLAPNESAQVTLNLPNESQLQTFDSMAIEAHVRCPNDAEGPNGGCVSVPNTLQLYLCESPGICSTELARWATPFARSGSWLMDVSPLLPLLGSGGETTFEIRAEHAVSVEAHLVLYDTKGPDRAVAAVPLWNHPQGQPFDQAYCTAQPSVVVQAPEGATRAEVVTRITGHGETGTIDACAANCNHAHHIGVGESVVTLDFPEAGLDGACLDLAAGVTPNQFGLWTLGRAGWCAGAGVRLEHQDVTEALGAGQTITYHADREGAPYVAFTVDPEGSMPSIKMASWMIFYAPRPD